MKNRKSAQKSVLPLTLAIGVVLTSIISCGPVGLASIAGSGGGDAPPPQIVVGEAIVSLDDVVIEAGETYRGLIILPSVAGKSVGGGTRAWPQ